MRAHFPEQRLVIEPSAAFANHLLVTSLSVSGVVWGVGGGYFFNLHFLLDHREEELQFKISLTHVLHCLREKRIKFKNGIAIAKNFSPVQTNFKNEITEKLVTLFQKKKV